MRKTKRSIKKKEKRILRRICNKLRGVSSDESRWASGGETRDVLKDELIEELEESIMRRIKRRIKRRNF